MAESKMNKMNISLVIQLRLYVIMGSNWLGRKQFNVKAGTDGPKHSPNVFVSRRPLYVVLCLFTANRASFPTASHRQLVGSTSAHIFVLFLAIQCRRPDFPNGFLDPDRDYYNVQETAVFECNAGYTLNGVTEAECVDNDVWSEDIPTCERKLNGMCIVTIKQFTTSNDNNETITIKKISKNVSLPANQCSRPYIDNGRVEQDGDQFDVNALVSFVCDEGYSLQGQQRLYCLENGQWSDDFPSCVGELATSASSICCFIM